MGCGEVQVRFAPTAIRMCIGGGISEQAEACGMPWRDDDPGIASGIRGCAWRPRRKGPGGAAKPTPPRNIAFGCGPPVAHPAAIQPASRWRLDKGRRVCEAQSRVGMIVTGLTANKGAKSAALSRSGGSWSADNGGGWPPATAAKRSHQSAAIHDEPTSFGSGDAALDVCRLRGGIAIQSS